MIEFDSDGLGGNRTFAPGVRPGQPAHSGILGWLLTKGIARTETQARYILLSVTVLCIVLAIVITYKNFYGGKRYSAEEIQRMVNDVGTPASQ